MDIDGMRNVIVYKSHMGDFYNFQIMRKIIDNLVISRGLNVINPKIYQICFLAIILSFLERYSFMHLYQYNLGPPFTRWIHNSSEWKAKIIPVQELSEHEK